MSVNVWNSQAKRMGGVAQATVTTDRKTAECNWPWPTAISPIYDDPTYMYLLPEVTERKDVAW